MHWPISAAAFLTHGFWPLIYWGCEYESHSRHGLFSFLCFASSVDVNAFVTGRSPVQGVLLNVELIYNFRF
jgi:hypothetical protein